MRGWCGRRGQVATGLGDAGPCWNVPDPYDVPVGPLGRGLSFGGSRRLVMGMYRYLAGRLGVVDLKQRQRATDALGFGASGCHGQS